MELVCVDLLAPLELRKPPAGLGFVGIYLPAAGAFTILAPVENEPHHVAQGIAQKQADFVGAVDPVGQSLLQLPERFFRLGSVAHLLQK